MKLIRQSTVLALALVTAYFGSAALADSHAGDSTDERLRAVITGEHRSAEKRARDAYRNPYETLTFFGLREDMTVLEINATGGWYTEIIAPVVAGTGKYFATMWDPDTSEWARGAFNELAGLIDADRELYGDAEVVSISGDNFRPIEPGSADLVLTFRNIHNWMTSGSIHDMLEMMYVSAKLGGHLGIVEHRGNPLIRQETPRPSPVTSTRAIPSGLPKRPDGSWSRPATSTTIRWTTRTTRSASGACRPRFVTWRSKAGPKWTRRSGSRVWRSAKATASRFSS